MATVDIMPIIPYADGEAAGKELGRECLVQRTSEALHDRYLKPTLGAMSRAELSQQVMARLEMLPNYSLYPELEDIYPERLEYLRGLAEGADCTLAEAAVYSYVTFRQDIDTWYWSHQLQLEPGHCSGALMDGPDGMLGGKSTDGFPRTPRPEGYRWRPPIPYAGLRQLKTEYSNPTLRKPRTGYIENCGVCNEKGVACVASVSCSVLLDEPIEDTWPIGQVPLLRFAADARQLGELYTRYTLHNWTRANQIWADINGNGVAVEKCFRRIGLLWMGDDRVLWCTEGHFESPEMFAYMRAKRLEYLEKAEKDLGAEDMQYATDCAVRFTRMAELCHEPWGRGREHMRRVLTDHATFPRAVCRHGGPDTAPYDQTVTQASTIYDLTHNRLMRREWTPWKRFCCQVPEKVTQYPPLP